MIEREFDAEVRPEEIWQNNYPAAKWLDLARWGVQAKMKTGGSLNVHSWDTMGEILKRGLAVVNQDNCGIEVCSK